MKRLFVLIAILVMTFSVFAQSAFYEGDGGKGLSIEVVKAEVKGKVSDEQEWFPDFAANMIHDDMEKYSAIRMIDGTNIEAQMDVDDRNLNSGLFEGASNLNYQAADHTLFVTLSVTPGGYNLSVRINKSNETKASHNKNYSTADMNSGLALKAAVADLLEQLGVRLTAKGKESLLSVDSSDAHDAIEAQKLNAQAQLAEQNGNNIEALTYLVKAKKSDNNLKRTSYAIGNIGTKITSGDIGAQVRNQIQLRKEFIALLDETESYFSEECPFFIVYEPEITLGDINYQRETMDISFNTHRYPTQDAFSIIKSILLSYETMPDHENWGIGSRINELKYNYRSKYNRYEQNYINDFYAVLYTANGVEVPKVGKQSSKNFYYSDDKLTFTIPATTDTTGLYFVSNVPQISEEQFLKEEIPLLNGRVKEKYAKTNTYKSYVSSPGGYYVSKTFYYILVDDTLAPYLNSHASINKYIYQDINEPYGATEYTLDPYITTLYGRIYASFAPDKIQGTMQRDEMDKIGGAFIGCQLDDSVLEAVGVEADSAKTSSSIVGIVAGIIGAIALLVWLFIL